MAGEPRRSGNAAVSIIAVSCGLVLAGLPMFLVGGLAVQIRAELGFGEAALGAALAAAFLIGACAAPLGGRLADRIGARAAVCAGSTLSAVGLVGIAGAAHSWVQVAAMLGLCGLAMAITDPGLAILVARAVPVTRQGLAFGVKEASVPIATLLAGLAVPTIALTRGWRWAFYVGLVPLAGLALLLPRVDLTRRTGSIPAGTSEARAVTADQPPTAALMLVTVAAALGVAAATGVGMFLTESAVAMGLSPARAGLLLAAGSVAGIVTRIATGVLADRDGGEQLGVISCMLAVGAATMTVAASGTGPLLVVGAIGAFAAGWGWSGLLFFSLVRAFPAAPGAAAGRGLAGLAAGNALGPLLFGGAAQTVSFGAAWTGAGAIAAVAALLMWLARSRFSAAGHDGYRPSADSTSP
jgi:MFS family permease